MSATVIPGLTLGGEPRAQLLPASVKLREKARNTRQLMVMLVVLAIVVAGAGTFGAFWLAQQAETQLAAEQARTLDLLAQQAEYAEGANVAAQVEATENAQRMITANEIDWLEAHHNGGGLPPVRLRSRHQLRRPRPVGADAHS